MSENETAAVDVFAPTADAVPAPEAAPTAPEPKKRGRKKKEAPAQDIAAETVAPALAPESPPPEEPEAADPVANPEPVAAMSAANSGPGWYVCIRECFGARTYRKGQRYELPDNISPDNFRKVNDA